MAHDDVSVFMAELVVGCLSVKMKKRENIIIIIIIG